MEIKPIDLPELAGIVLGMTLVIIPVLGATIRFAARPFVEALITSGLVRRGEQIVGTDNGKLIRRIQELELEVALLKSKDVDVLRQRVS
ncbi:MAG: hypothetical protein QM817_25035 [Archangium sp.]